MPTPNKIDSNITGLAIAEESALKVLPGTDGADAVWYGLEPDGYNDFGAEVTTVARAPISGNRQRKKGVTTDLDASGGFTQDFTQSNLTRIMQGFFFADAREKATTASLKAAKIALTGVTSTEYQAVSGLGAFAAGQLVLASGFNVATNNGLKLVTAADTDSVAVAGLTVEANPTNGKLQAVGFEFEEADVTLTVAGQVVTLAATNGDFAALGLSPGEWIFVGGDDEANRFDSAFYGRVSAIAAKTLSLEECTGTPQASDGAGKSIRVFFGTFMRNEATQSLIKRRSYSIERQLGNDGDGIQSQILKGAVANEFTLNIPQADKLNAELSFVALDEVSRTGAQGLSAGTRVPAPGEEAFNTSSDIYRQRLAIHGSATPLFGYATEATIAINNGVTLNKAIGVLGGFDTSAGDFEVTGSITPYFSTVAAVQAVRNNADVSYSVIAAQRNAGVVFDMPLITLSGGRVNVEKDNAIMIPVDTSASENKYGFTLGLTTFHYLPNVGMPA